MTYVLSIDWLALYCLHMDVGAWQPSKSDGSLLGAYPWRYKLADYGTRQFKQLYFVSMPNPEGGFDDFAEVQACPYAHILKSNAIIIRFVNRALYTPDFWELANRFLSDNNFVFQSISRIDICADFNDFATMSPLALIEGFAAKNLRHVGRGVGALYFNHGVEHNRLTGERDYGVRYTGLSFGTHSSDARVYLYNKSFELLTQGDKPWIRDTWVSAGLDVRNVWRLEVSLKSDGCRFKDKQTGEKVAVDLERSKDTDELDKIYRTFVMKLFAFVKNRRGITNISREPRITLFEGFPMYIHKCIRNVSPGNKFERMFIKALYQMGDLYRGGDVKDNVLTAQALAYDLAAATDLEPWLGNKILEWEKPNHK